MRIHFQWVGLEITTLLLSQHTRWVFFGMDSSLGFKVISSGRADADMNEEVSDGASTGFEIQGASKYKSSWKRGVYLSHNLSCVTQRPI